MSIPSKDIKIKNAVIMIDSVLRFICLSIVHLIHFLDYLSEKRGSFPIFHRRGRSWISLWFYSSWCLFLEFLLLQYLWLYIQVTGGYLGPICGTCSFSCWSLISTLVSETRYRQNWILASFRVVYLEITRIHWVYMVHITTLSNRWYWIW